MAEWYRTAHSPCRHPETQVQSRSIVISSRVLQSSSTTRLHMTWMEGLIFHVSNTGKSRYMSRSHEASATVTMRNLPLIV